jgi:hypothetical protein
LPFTNSLPEWNMQGVEPPQSLKDNGWEAQQKPPADYFNWFQFTAYNALKELQENVIHAEEKGATNGVATLGPDGKVPSSQLNISAPPDASTTQKGIVQLEDSTASTSITKAATPNSVKSVNDSLVSHSTDITNPHKITTTQVNHLGSYMRNVADTPDSYPLGVTSVFVGPSEQHGSWGFYGTVVTYKTYDAGGGTFQTYTPYGEGTTSLGDGEYRVRFWIYGENMWSEWKAFETKDRLDEHQADGTAHITASERINWNSKAAGSHNHDGVYEPILPTEQKRRIFIQTAAPATPQEGDIWIEV